MTQVHTDGDIRVVFIPKYGNVRKAVLITGQNKAQIIAGALWVNQWFIGNEPLPVSPIINCLYAIWDKSMDIHDKMWEDVVNFKIDKGYNFEIYPLMN